MEKDQIIEHLRAAKSAHIKWVQKAKLLINGIEVEKDAIPVDSTECKFGKWFYGDGQVLNALSNNPVECMVAIEELHSELHDIYMNIFHIYFSKQSGGLLSKIFGTKKKITQEESIRALDYYDKLETVSKKLLDEINRLERRLLAVPDEKIRELV
ncbi:CZB domain-containing protein [Sulfurimonas sp.]|uniref:CZB domain-containing protein n=1 Tax=Sulfurimonas sp. TaxID=2022749 RepID=UPI0035693051